MALWTEAAATPGFVEAGAGAPKRVRAVQFCMQDVQEIIRAGEFQVVNHALYGGARRTPVPDGLLDARLGVASKAGACGTCGRRIDDCPGHWAYLRLRLPVLNLGYVKQIVQVLQAVCKTCARVMLPDGERARFLARMRSPRSDGLARARLLREILARCKKHAKECPHCGACNGTVKKLGPSKIVHEAYHAGHAGRLTAAGEQLARDCGEAQVAIRELHANVDKAHDDITPLRALRIFRAMTPDDIELLDMDPVHGPPERFVVQYLPVPPVCIRPTVQSDGTQGSTEDDLTVKLAEIIGTGNRLQDNILKHGSVNTVTFVECWELLQDQVAMYINSSLPGLAAKVAGGFGAAGGFARRVSKKPVRSLCSRLKGKHGRFRGNLCGKRADFTARTVISPDPNLFVWEVGVPVYIARNLTYPERATPANIAYLRKLIENGPDVHPGANFVRCSDGTKRFLKFNRMKAAAELRIGDVVERHMRDGDVVLFNRQPSLHRISIMAHRARIFPSRTLRFNESVCTPYNADFDGDEMNLHLPQTEEARAEAAELLAVTHNLVTPRTGDILVASTQDFLTTGFLLTRRDMFYDRGHFAQLCVYCGDALEQIDMPYPTVLKPAVLWTGKQAIGIVIRPNRSIPVFLNTECKSKTYSGEGMYACPRDGYVCFRNSELMCGTLDKATLGGGSKNSIWHVLMRDYSPHIAAEAMSRLAKLSARWIGDQGFSIGISDVTPSARLTHKKQQLVRDGEHKCTELIAQFRSGDLQPQAGMSAEQTLESLLTGELSDVRDKAGKMCFGELHYNNSPLIMAQCGSKGSTINISQMIACVGQQVISGSRIPNGFIRRSLPHFPIDSKEPRAKGFVSNSFFTGLDPDEFFFHTQGGREGLVDTAVKTAETGYMQRRLMKALEDLHIHYDSSVRNSEMAIVQLTYGEDNLDPSFMEAADKPVFFENVLMNLLALNPCPGEAALRPYEIRTEINALLESPERREAAERFGDDIRGFWFGRADAKGKHVSGWADRLAALRTQYGLLPALEDPAAQDEAEADDPEKLLPVSNVSRVTKTQLCIFVDTCYRKYLRATAEPGTAVGALAAQSMGEPTTQMTLKTFHFAGVASMNVSLGVPRIKEIINATRKIATPIINAALVTNNDATSARIVKGRIERTTLGEVVSGIHEVYKPESCYVSVRLDTNTISLLQLDLNASIVRAAILEDKAAKKLKIKDKNILVISPFKLRVFPPQGQRDRTFFIMQRLRSVLPSVVVAGINGIGRAVISDKGGVLELGVEGQELARVMGTPGVIGEQTVCNHIAVVERVLGIEAARSTIMSEVVKVMQNHGMAIDARHTMLVADLMTFKGVVLAITRFGISKMKESVLALASFERMTDFLFDAGAHSRVDHIRGVSERVIIGAPMPIGTGLFKIIQNMPYGQSFHTGERPTLLSSTTDEMHVHITAAAPMEEDS